MSHNISEQFAHLSPIKQALLATLVLQSKIGAMEQQKSEPEAWALGIAIIGLGCRFPGGADSPASFWQLLREGADAVTEMPADRWNRELYYDSDPDALGKMYTRYGSFLSPEQALGFEPQFFGISPREAMAMDPQQRLLLEVSWEALENAGRLIRLPDSGFLWALGRMIIRSYPISIRMITGSLALMMAVGIFFVLLQAVCPIF